MPFDFVADQDQNSDPGMFNGIFVIIHADHVVQSAWILF